MLFFSSCKQQQQSNHKYDKYLYDIPCIVGVKPQVQKYTSKSISIVYQCPLVVAEVVEFYQREMERYGWQHVVTFDIEYSLMHFKKPYNFCSVIIKTLPKHYSEVEILLEKKKQEKIYA